MDGLTASCTGEGWGVFFDRDGTLNEHVMRAGHRSSPRHRGEWRPRPAASAAVARLRDAGARIAVITNQPDVGRRLIDEEELCRMHRLLDGVEAVYTCPHPASHRCRCRKPSARLVRRAASQLYVCSAASYFVGDRPTDAQAGITAGLTALTLTPRPRTSLVPGLHYALDLSDAAETILRLRDLSAHPHEREHRR